MRRKRQKSTGRKSGKAEKVRTIADSVNQAAAMLGVPVRLLRNAKDAGCPAFRGGRVHLVEVQEWLAKSENTNALAERANELEKIELDIAREKLRLARHRADVETGAFVAKEAVKRDLTRHVMVAKTRLLAIPSSAAPILAGLVNPVEIEEKLKQFVFDAIDELAGVVK